MDSSLPVFIDLPEKDQAKEIRQYLNSAGADLGDYSKENIHDELSSLLDACDNWLKSASDADLEAMMNSFISLILFCANDAKLTKKFILKLTDIGASENNALLRIKLLNNFFIGLPDNNPLRYDVYIGQLQLSIKFGHTKMMTTQLKKIKEWLGVWNVELEEKRTCYRLLHAALKHEHRSDEATRVMLELLSTYDEECASLAKDDAVECIIDFISKPDVFIMDHLLQLKPVSALKGQLIYELLTIFVSGQLNDYNTFCTNNPDFIEKSGLDHLANIEKMKILTMISLANQEKEITYQKIIQTLGLTEDNLEEFVIELVKSGLVHAKIDQINERIIIRSVGFRTFGKNEWESLQQKLQTWVTNLNVIKTNLEQVVQS
ncbi:eukaryotic translation initiation factor 3 subunit M isoform X2 [Hydra vulgaris]|uniref:Eukaryotic translation initiation factor 3 subunit M n=1 Tax=Hydra vulgaris TaxID=6087 RepID=A0ABM4BEG8_HYDVU